MAHDWVPVRKTAATFMTPDARVCSKCEARQELSVEQSWGRIVSRRWLPLVGRCKPKKKAQ